MGDPQEAQFNCWVSIVYTSILKLKSCNDVPRWAAQRIGSAAAAGQADTLPIMAHSGKSRLRGAAVPLSDWSRCWAALIAHLL